MVTYMLITFQNVAWQYLDKPILKDASFTINEDTKIGVIGMNGAGKSTILKLMVNELSPSSGVIYRKNQIQIGYLSQHILYESENTILEEAKRLSQVENDYELVSMLNKLGLVDHQKKVGLLSGGEQKRLQLACVLVGKVDLLILDEPTNHLDIAMIQWLENYLIQYNKALILVTHDRYFLERVTHQIMEIENGKVYWYDTNYSGFLKLKAERLESLRANERKLSAILKKEAKWMALNPQARSTKSKERIMRFDDYQENLGQIKDAIKESEREMEFTSQKTRMGKKTILLENVDIEIEGKKLIQNLNYIVNRYDRLGIVGNNGCGKTSFFHAILNPNERHTGKITIGETIRIGYFKQINEIMDTQIKVIDYLKQYGEYITTESGNLSASALLENYLFTPAMQQLSVSRLSGGEKRRLGLLKVLITSPNVLLLDEPTNDLDIYTIEILEDYIEQFKGAVLVISHDRYFLDKVCNHLLVVQHNQANIYEHSITEYLKDHDFEEEKKNSKAKIQSVKKEIPRFTSKEKKEYDQIEEEIVNLEKELAEIIAQMGKIETDYQKLLRLTHLKEEIEQKINEKMTRWEYLETIHQKIILYKENKYNEE